MEHNLILLPYFPISKHKIKRKNTDIPTEKRHFKTEKYAHFSILNKCLSYWNHLQNVLKHILRITSTKTLLSENQGLATVPVVEP